MNRWLVVSLALVALSFATPLVVHALYYDELPQRVPIHWNIHDEPDGWAARDGIWKIWLLLPVMMLGTLGLLAVLPYLSPKQFQVGSFKATYWYVCALAMGLMAYLEIVIVYASFERGGSVGRMLIAGMLLFFALIGNVLGKIKRNFWMGIRTPWTLASDRVWADTHRLAAWLMVAGGLIGFVAIISGAPLLWSFGVCLAVTLGVPVIYSLVHYKQLERQGRL